MLYACITLTSLFTCTSSLGRTFPLLLQLSSTLALFYMYTLGCTVEIMLLNLLSIFLSEMMKKSFYSTVVYLELTLDY